MTAENRDIHSYNCDVYITHEGEIYQVNILNGLEIAMERKGSPSKCTFQILQEEDGAIQFEEGDSVKVRISQRWVFYGFIFTKSHSADGVLKIVCYDQIRYLKAKESVVFINKTVGEIVTALAKDRGLQLGTIRDSSYKIPTLTKENATMYDIIMTAIEETTSHTGEIFILYDRCGHLTLCPLKHMYRNVIIDCDVIQDYDYESTIDKQTYNMVRVGYKSKADGKLTYVTARDQKNINKWGMLQLTETSENGWQATTRAKQLLDMYNSKTRTLKIKGAMGANEVVGGSLVLVKLDLGDIKLSQNMVVDAVTHRVEDGLYSMDLELIGGEFVSTRGVQQDESQKKNEQSAINHRVVLNSYKGSLTYKKGSHSKTLTESQINKIIELCRKYKILPSLILTQMWAESFWGDSAVGRKNNNWGGITWPYKGDKSVSKYKGTPRPSREGGNYVKWNSAEDYFVDHFYLFREGGYYKVRGKTDINGFINGLMTKSRGGEASANYAAGDGYRELMKSVYSGLNSSLGKQLRDIDKLVYDGGQWQTGATYSSIDDSTNLGNSVIERAIGYARSRVGKSYVDGGKTYSTYAQNHNSLGKTSNAKYCRNSYLYNPPANARTFDCSSLCFYAYVNAGYLKAGGNAMTTGDLKDNPEAYKMKKVPLSRAKRGDILWRKGHAGLYLGNGATIEANSPSEGINYHPNNLKRFSVAYRPYLADKEGD